MTASAIRAVLFDLDGVLVDVEAFHCRALSGALVAHEYDPVYLDEYRDIHRHSTAEKLRILKVRAADAHHVLALKHMLFPWLLERHFVPDPAVVLALQAIARPPAFRLSGVVSNGARASVEGVLDRFPDGLVDDWVCGDDAPRKPAPDLYLLMARKLNLLPYECVAVEDRDDGIAAAKAAGMRVVVVSGPQDVTVERMRAEGLA